MPGSPPPDYRRRQHRNVTTVIDGCMDLVDAQRVLATAAVNHQRPAGPWRQREELRRLGSMSSAPCRRRRRG